MLPSGWTTRGTGDGLFLLAEKVAWWDLLGNNGISPESKAAVEALAEPGAEFGRDDDGRGDDLRCSCAGPVRGEPVRKGSPYDAYCCLRGAG